ncbi:MAG: hypothetical protein K0Q94_6229 [Paenibacillus sp.]|jgi:hypothetical protein|nr:hypothetical protein [Paenibacillus sp.]
MQKKPMRQSMGYYLVWSFYLELSSMNFYPEHLP